MKNIILNVKNLSVSLGNEKIIENLSFKVREGEVLVVLGPNGAGKTVLLKTLIGAFPYKGKIIWKKGTKIGYVPQRLPFIKNVPLSVKEFFFLKKVSQEEINNIMDSLKVSKDILDKKIGDLSSGQFQRILVGWALIGNPQVLLFDEPFAGIDISGQESIYDLLKELKEQKNLTILLVSHELNIVYKFASKILCLRKKLLCYGTPLEILSPESLAELYGGEVKFHFHKNTKNYD